MAWAEAERKEQKLVETQSLPGSFLHTRVTVVNFPVAGWLAQFTTASPSFPPLLHQGPTGNQQLWLALCWVESFSWHPRPTEHKAACMHGYVHRLPPQQPWHLLKQQLPGVSAASQADGIRGQSANIARLSHMMGCFLSGGCQPMVPEAEKTSHRGGLIPQQWVLWG